MMSEKDDFWNIGRIVPNKKIQHGMIPEVKPVDVVSDSAFVPCDVDLQSLFGALKDNKSLNTVESAIVKEKEYEHFEKSNVIIMAYVGEYNNLMQYQNKIRSYALDYFSKEVEFTPPYADYFSYKPSFDELSFEQLNYYIYWRNNVKKGIFEKVSDSYILLFITEIVNLPDRFSSEYGIQLICDLWINCSQTSNIDKIVSDIIFEYCVVHNIPVPYKKLEAKLQIANLPSSHILLVLFAFDYVLAQKSELTNCDVEFVLKNLLNYSFISNKHYKENSDFRNLTDLHFYDVFRTFLNSNPSYISDLLQKRKSRTAPTKVIKPAFLYINTSLEIKRNIVYEYYPFEKNDIDFDRLLNIAKYTENKFRVASSVKAKLAVSQISLEDKSKIDDILNTVLFSKNKYGTEKRVVKNKILKVDIEKAKNIELSSWQTTKMLTEGIDTFSDDTDDVVLLSEDFSDSGENSGKLGDFEIYIINCLINSQYEKAVSECSSKGVFFDSVMTAINEKMFDVFDDTVLDLQNGRVYDEYLDDVKIYISRSKDGSL